MRIEVLIAASVNRQHLFFRCWKLEGIFIIRYLTSGVICGLDQGKNNAQCDCDCVECLHQGVVDGRPLITGRVVDFNVTQCFSELPKTATGIKSLVDDRLVGNVLAKHKLKDDTFGNLFFGSSQWPWSV